uniref:Uncharacterized protein n=1 Tax=Rhizophora mucronata TaxID=61149 RepID=A0A2P2JZG0_RHIMU
MTQNFKSDGTVTW